MIYENNLTPFASEDVLDEEEEEEKEEEEKEEEM